MIRKIIFVIIFITVSSICFADDIGISSSGKDISLNFWSLPKDQSNSGWYVRALFDFETYKNNDVVSICRDGSVSGSRGSGTCSGHRGVSHSELAQFKRFGVAIGPTFWVLNKIQLHGGVLLGLYSSNINIGDKGVLNYMEVGFDFGIGIKLIDASRFNFVLSRETNQARTSIGMRLAM
jgi:hypothetical protein